MTFALRVMWDLYLSMGMWAVLLGASHGWDLYRQDPYTPFQVSRRTRIIAYAWTLSALGILAIAFGILAHGILWGYR